MSSEKRENLLRKYEPHEWVRKLQNVPDYYIELAHKNTPIHKWNIPWVPEPFELYIKRDDMTGSTLTGNKVRKLEFLMGDAISQGCDTIITSGDTCSNHCRATAIASRQLGLEPYLFILRHVNQGKHFTSLTGNLLLDRLSGSNIVFVPKTTHTPSYESSLKPRVDEFVEMLRANGKRPFVIPRGGAHVTGLFGYINAFQEMIDQGVLDKFDDIFVTIGSGGTTAGIALGNYLTGSKLRCHAVSIRKSSEWCYEKMNEELREVGIDVDSREMVRVYDQYNGEGYARTTQLEMNDLVRISSSTGIILDPSYTLKTVRGMLSEMKNHPESFKGNRVLFVHTGGLFGSFDGPLEQLLCHDHDILPPIKWWRELVSEHEASSNSNEINLNNWNQEDLHADAGGLINGRCAGSRDYVPYINGFHENSPHDSDANEVYTKDRHAVNGYCNGLDSDGSTSSNYKHRRVEDSECDHNQNSLQTKCFLNSHINDSERFVVNYNGIFASSFSDDHKNGRELLNGRYNGANNGLFNGIDDDHVGH